MTKRDKFFAIIKRYNVHLKNNSIDDNYIEDLLVRNCMLIAWNSHNDIQFETFVRSCVSDPLNYLFNLSERLETEFYELDLLNNCFNDKSNKHFGVKVNGNWFFITHCKNTFSLSLYQTDFAIPTKDRIGISYLTSFKNVSPNILKKNVGKIKKSIIKRYEFEFLKTKS